jgi:hypothetical protein
MHFRIVLLLGILSCGAVAVAESQDTPDSQNVSYDDLALVGDEINRWKTFRDNEFLYAGHVDKIYAAAKPLVESQRAFTVSVDRVTRREVFLVVRKAGETRVALRHAESPEYGNLGSVGYCGPRSARYANLLSKKIALRIGSEIELAIARRLRYGDLRIPRNWRRPRARSCAGSTCGMIGCLAKGGPPRKFRAL